MWQKSHAAEVTCLSYVNFRWLNTYIVLFHSNWQKQANTTRLIFYGFLLYLRVGNCSLHPQFIPISLDKWANLKSKSVKTKRTKNEKIMDKSAILAQIPEIASISGNHGITAHKMLMSEEILWLRGWQKTHCYNGLKFALENRNIFIKSTKLSTKNSKQTEFWSKNT